jgi:negative regulator of flagellin synthesis FlgM
MTRIDGLNPLTTNRANQGQGPQGVASGATREDDLSRIGGPQDNITLSSRSRVVADVAGFVASAPDVRSAKVAELRAAIAGGSYRVNAQDIASRLFATGTFGAES